MIQTTLFPWRWSTIAESRFGEKFRNAWAYCIFVLIRFVVITFLIDIAQIESEQKSIKPKNPQRLAENQIQDGQLYAALDTYTGILTETPDDEYAWHQKGKLLNRLSLCDDAQLHYEKYLDRFPNSLRGLEGAEIAKTCGS